MRPGVPDDHVDAAPRARRSAALYPDAAVRRAALVTPRFLPSDRDLLRDLVRELARRQHYQRLDDLLLASTSTASTIGNAEGAGLAAPGLRLDDEIPASAHKRDRLGLDGHRGRSIRARVERGLDVFGGKVSEKVSDSSVI